MIGFAIQSRYQKIDYHGSKYSDLPPPAVNSPAGQATIHFKVIYKKSQVTPEVLKPPTQLRSHLPPSSFSVAGGSIHNFTLLHTASIAQQLEIEARGNPVIMLDQG